MEYCSIVDLGYVDTVVLKSWSNVILLMYMYLISIRSSTSGTLPRAVWANHQLTGTGSISPVQSKM